MLQTLCRPTSHDLILLSCWGGLYFGTVVAVTRSTSERIVEIVELLILPHISEEVAESVREKIETSFVERRIFRTSLVVAGIFLVISVYILHRHNWFELWIWSLGFFILYFTASQTTYTATFYTCFSHSLKMTDEGFSGIDPVESPAILACEVLGRRMLGYWFIVFLLVMSLMAIPQLSHAHFLSGFVGTLSDDITVFVIAGIVIAGFFSFIFGSLVYLRFQRDLQIGAFRARFAKLSAVQDRYNELFAKLGDLTPDESLQIDRLKTASDYLLKSGYSNSLQALGALAAAVLPPVLSVIGAVLTAKWKK